MPRDALSHRLSPVILGEKISACVLLGRWKNKVWLRWKVHWLV